MLRRLDRAENAEHIGAGAFPDYRKRWSAGLLPRAAYERHPPDIDHDGDATLAEFACSAP